MYFILWIKVSLWSLGARLGGWSPWQTIWKGAFIVPILYWGEVRHSNLIYGEDSVRWCTHTQILEHQMAHQFSSATQSCPTLCDSMDCSTSGFPVYHQLLQPNQAHVHRVSDAIQPSQPLSSPSIPAFKLSQHKGLFQWDSSSHKFAKVLQFQLLHQPFKWIFRTDFL